MRAKKSLGQNFLKSSLALKKIIEAGEIKSTDVILEIGPGRGVLTEKLLGHAGKVIAVEKDNQLFLFLKEKFEKEIEEKKLILVNDDILSFTEQKFSQSLGDELRSTTPSKTSTPFHYKIIANIPYNITGAILKKFLTEKNQPECMVLMVQHEVAKRIMGRSKNPSTPLRVKESLLSISVKVYGEPKMIMKVPARYFSPAPKVDSAIIAITNISRQVFTKNKVNETVFWEIVRAGFAHKRKKLSSNLKSLKFRGGGNASAPNIGNSYAESLGNKRAEDLSLSDWINLAK